MFNRRQRIRGAIILSLALSAMARGQQAPVADHAGFVPVISGGAGYVHNVNGGVPTLLPQINPVLLVPFGRHVLLESRTDFTGFFQRENFTDGPFKGKVFKTVEFAQVEWLANTHLTLVAGKYLLPFGIYNERLQPIWIKNLQDAPITSVIGTRTSGAGEGFQLRGVATQHSSYSIQYSAYFSVRSNINQLQAARTSGGDVSVFLPHPRLEIGTSYQRLLQGQQINSSAVYLSWQPRQVPVDLKVEFDGSYYGKGFWLESSYNFTSLPVPSLVKKTQIVGRVQQFAPSHGGGNSLPRVSNQRVDFGLNYYVRDDLRFISSYGRNFSSQGNANVWNVGFTYRFTFPLWPAGRSR